MPSQGQGTDCKACLGVAFFGGGRVVECAVRGLAVADEARPEVNVDHREVHYNVRKVRKLGFVTFFVLIALICGHN